MYLVKFPQHGTVAQLLSVWFVIWLSWVQFPSRVRLLQCFVWGCIMIDISKQYEVLFNRLFSSRFDIVDVVGTVVDRNRAICVQPFLMAEGYVIFDIKIGEGQYNWKGKYFVGK